MSKDLEMDLDDILGDAIDTVANSEDASQNDKSSQTREHQNDNSDDAEEGFDIDELAGFLNEESGTDLSSNDESSKPDELSFLDGDDGLVPDESKEEASINVDDILGQANDTEEANGGNTEVEPEIEPEVEPEIEPEVEPEIEPEIEPEFDIDGDDPLADFTVDDAEDDPLNEFSGSEASSTETNVEIEPDIEDDFMSDMNHSSDDDEVVDITSDEFEVSTEKFRPHTDVEDVEEILGGGVGGLFASKEKEKSEEAITDTTANEPVALEAEEEELPKKDEKLVQEVDNGKAIKDVASQKSGFGVKSLIATAMGTAILTLGIGGGLLVGFGDKIIGKDTFVDNAALESRMVEVMGKLENSIAEGKVEQISKGEVKKGLEEVSKDISQAVSEFKQGAQNLQNQLDAVVKTQSVDRAEFEAINAKALLLLNQFVDDTKDAESRMSEQVYAKVVKIVKEEFSGKDDTIKLDEVLKTVSQLRSEQSALGNRVQTQMNLIGVLESENEFLSKRLASIESSKPEASEKTASSKTKLKTGYTDENGDRWGYLEVQTKDGLTSGSHFKYKNEDAGKPVNTLPYVLKGVFLTGSANNPEYKVYLIPRAQVNGSPMGYKVGQQVPGIGRILRVEPTNGHEKVPYLVYTDLGVLRSDK